MGKKKKTKQTEQNEAQQDKARQKLVFWLVNIYVFFLPTE